MVEAIEVLEDQLNKGIDRLNKENWDLKQKLNKTENYIKFKSLWEDFEEVSASTNKCSDGTKIPEGGCFGCGEGSLCE